MNGQKEKQKQSEEKELKKEGEEIKEEKRGNLETIGESEGTKKKLSECLCKREEYLDGWKRERAGFLNYKKEELELIKHLSYFPDLIEEVARNYQVQHLTTYAITLADLFHKFYENCRVLNAENEELKTARLSLVLASKLVLANVLGIMGIDAPERM